MVGERSKILDAAQIKQKIRRIASEIYENNFNEKTIILAGIEGHGYTLATLLAKELEVIAPFTLKIVKVNIDKMAPQQSEINIDCDVKDIKKKCIVLVDDVLNTGRTFAYGMKPFLKTEVKKIEIAVLVNRGHANFPVYSNYTGYELSTTLKEHVEVRLGDEDAGVYLH